MDLSNKHEGLTMTTKQVTPTSVDSSTQSMGIREDFAYWLVGPMGIAKWVYFTRVNSTKVVAHSYSHNSGFW